MGYRNKYDLFIKWRFFLILNIHSDFWEQLFSDVSAKVPCNIATCKVICHSCCITKVEILVWKNFLNFDLKSIITLKHSSATKTFEDYIFCACCGWLEMLSPPPLRFCLQKSQKMIFSEEKSSVSNLLLLKIHKTFNSDSIFIDSKRHWKQNEMKIY